MMSTRLLPMSWTSPRTVASTMVPLPSSSDFSMCGSRWATAVFMTSPRVLRDLVEEALQGGARGDEPGQCRPHGLRQADGRELPAPQPRLDLLGQLGERE